MVRFLQAVTSSHSILVFCLFFDCIVRCMQDDFYFIFFKKALG